MAGEVRTTTRPAGYTGTIGKLMVEWHERNRSRIETTVTNALSVTCNCLAYWWFRYGLRPTQPPRTNLETLCTHMSKD
jgi:hypothetical protein